MEAAHITWRPLGRLLVEQGLLTGEELEQALAKQHETGERLGETIVKCGFVSGPELASALAAQYGIELMTEKGFGTGLRSEIQRRHETDRRRVVQLVPDPPLQLSAVEEDPEPVELESIEPDRAAKEGLLLAQLEEQWAKLAAAEASLVDRERELEELTRRHGRRRSQLTRFAARVRERDRRLDHRLREVRQLEEVNEHLRGVVDEARTQCYAVQTTEAVALALGVEQADARVIAVSVALDDARSPKGEYHSPHCRPGGVYDLHADTRAWPSG